MRPHVLNELSAALPVLDLAAQPTYEEALAAAAPLGALGRLDVALARFKGRPPWERHPDDELLVVVDGEVELTLWARDEPEVVVMRAGSLFIVPGGVWHRSYARDGVTVVAATSVEGNERSTASDPRS